MESNYPRWFINHHCTLHDVSKGMKIYVPKTSVIFNDSVKKIRKVSVGERNLDCPEKVLMLVGATGSGKSTLINAILNYIVGVQWEDDFRLKLIYDETSLSQVHSQTDYITAYVIHHNSHASVPFTMTIIDTPGFGNTAGIERDKEIVEQMRTLFNVGGQNGIDKIDALGLVTLSSTSRLGPIYKYVFDAILSLFGKDIGDNIIMLLTFADGQKPRVLAGIKEAQMPYKKYFKFNNSDLYISKKDKDEFEYDKMFWILDIKNFKEFVVELDKLQQQTVKQTKQVLYRRIHLETTIKDLETNIDIGHATIQRLANLETDPKFEYQTGEIDRLVQKDANEFVATYMRILGLAEDTRKTMRMLELLALRMYPLTILDNIDILIDGEKIFGHKETIQKLEGVRSNVVMMQQIAEGTFDPFAKERTEKRSGVWTKVAKYLNPKFGYAFYIDMKSYQLAADEPRMGLSLESQTSSNPTSSLKGCETTNLHTKAANTGQIARAANSDQNVS